MTPDLADAIIEWTDTSNTSGGAGAQAYAMHSPAYANKSAPFESLEELALLNGATYEILYGEDANINGIVDPNEDDGDESAPADNSDGKLEPGVLSFFTCFSRETAMASDGTQRADASKALNFDLRGVLNELGGTPAGEINSRLEIYNPLPGRNKAPGGAGTFTSLLQLYVASQMTEDQFATIYDHLWIAPAGNKGYVDGLININTASEAVLACIPGITAKASEVVAARSKQAPGNTSITWLAALLSEQEATDAGPYITGRSYQVSADIAAVGRHGRGYRRARFVVDTTTGTPRIIYRRDLSSLGWALGSEARQTLADRKERAP
jgi:hypothetical protein